MVQSAELMVPDLTSRRCPRRVTPFGFNTNKTIAAARASRARTAWRSGDGSRTARLPTSASSPRTRPTVSGWRRSTKGAWSTKGVPAARGQALG